MRRWLLALGLVLLPLPALAQGGRLECVRVEAVARWGADAYNHFVVLHNGCAHRVRCQVATDVNPEAQVVEVAAGQTLEVITFRGSPASAFTPRVSCERR
jgi:hypothetical protein